MDEKKKNPNQPLSELTYNNKGVSFNFSPDLRKRKSQIDLIVSVDQQLNQQKENEFGSKENLLRPKDHNYGWRKNIEADKNADSESDREDVDDVFPDTYIIIEFEPHVSMKTLHWIIDKIRSKKINGGAELLLRMEPLSNTDSQGLTLHISATRMRFLELADEMAITKRTKNGSMRSFNVSCLDDFFLEENMSVDDLLTTADRQIIMKYALDIIKARETEHYFPGMEIIPLYHGESIIQAAIKAEIIKTMYSPHDQEYLKKIGPEWYMTPFKQPLDRIREYFGESIGIYFSFLHFYTTALVIPTVLGFLQLFLSIGTVPFFCIFYVVWMTVFLEIWKRRCSIHAYKWGTISMTYLDSPRIGYYGKLGKDPITGKITPQYPLWKTQVQMYFVSYPIIMCITFFATMMALAQFWIEDEMKTFLEPDSYLLYIPSICQSILVAFLSVQYDKLSVWLTDLENHRTQLQYDRHRINKLIVLEFVNNFVSLFYIAFVLRDINQLKSQLMIQLTIVQLAQNLQEMLVSMVFQKINIFREYIFKLPAKVVKKTKNDDEIKFEDLHIEILPEDSDRVVQNKYEINLNEYNSTYEDYLEIYIQFGYVVLFSSVVPLAAFFALINNFIELRLDAFKLCKMLKRPFARRAKDTGSWHLAFEVLAIMSIMTNLGILYLTPEMRSFLPNFTEVQLLVVFLILEHVLLAIIWCIHRLIPDRPHWIRIALAKADYDSRQALKREVGLR